eukprot:Pgem_evm1s19374
MNFITFLLIFAALAVSQGFAADECGCSSGQGWNNGRCEWGKHTNPTEAAACRSGGSYGSPSGGKDACGCTSGQGWNNGKCEWGRNTNPTEAAACKSGSSYTPPSYTPPSDGGHQTSGGRCNPHGKCKYQSSMKSNGACVLVHNGKVHMGKLTYDGRKWDFPGGTYGDHANVENSMCVAWRETCEEAGYNVNVGRHLGGGTFKCTLVPNSPSTFSRDRLSTRGEISEGRWFSLSEIQSMSKSEFRKGGYAWGDMKRKIMQALS